MRISCKMKLCSPQQGEESLHTETVIHRLPHCLRRWSSCGSDHCLVANQIWFSFSNGELTESMNNSLKTKKAWTNLCSETELCRGDSNWKWMRQVSLSSDDAARLVRAGGDQRSDVYMANKASSGLSGFLRLGVPCAAPGSPLGGDGRLGTVSAALALSSRNLSNSSLVTPSSPSSPSSPCCLRGGGERLSHLGAYSVKLIPPQTTTKLSSWACAQETPTWTKPHTAFHFTLTSQVLAQCKGATYPSLPLSVQRQHNFTSCLPNKSAGYRLSVMQHSEVSMKSCKASSFNADHEYKTTFLFNLLAVG